MATRNTSTPRTRKETKAEGNSAKLKPAAAPKPVPAESAEELKPKHKLVRDSFTIPKNEYALLDVLKQRATLLTRPAKKSEILRAGIGALNGMSDKAFVAALGSVPSLKTGRPKHAKANADKAPAKKARAVAEQAAHAEA